MVVRQPPVLLLDECTSALDPLTQEAVQKTILKDFPRPGPIDLNINVFIYFIYYIYF